MTNYSIMKTVWKALGVFVAVMAAVLAVPMLTEQELADAWPGYAIAVIAAAVKGYQNYVKHHTDMGLPMKAILPFLVLPLLFMGCVSTRFADTITHPDGRIDKTEYSGMSTAWPLGEIDATVHRMSYETGATDAGVQDQISVGQDAQGIDNTGMSVLVPLLQSFFDSLAESQRQANESGKSKDALLEALLRRLDATPAIP